MKYGLLLIATALVAAGIPPAAAQTQTECTAIAPLATLCQVEIYFGDGDVGDFVANLDTLVDFSSLTINFYPKNNHFPGGYDSTASMTCASATPTGCDGSYSDVENLGTTGPCGAGCTYQDGVYLLVAEVTGSSGGVGAWGWTWSIFSASGVGPTPCGGAPAHDQGSFPGLSECPV